MTSANVNVTAVEVRPLGGTNQNGLKLGFIDSATKANAADTFTVTNAKEIAWCNLTNDTSGAADPATTISANVITLSVGTGATSGLVLYK